MHSQVTCDTHRRLSRQRLLFEFMNQLYDVVTLGKFRLLRFLQMREFAAVDFFLQLIDLSQFFSKIFQSGCKRNVSGVLFVFDRRLSDASRDIVDAFFAAGQDRVLALDVNLLSGFLLLLALILLFSLLLAEGRIVFGRS